jgi:uncharacterized coiled-coil DUF342 family protein
MLKEMIVKIDEKIDELKLEMVGVTVDIKELKKKLLKKDDENTNKDADDVDKDADDVDDDAAADAYRISGLVGPRISSKAFKP